MSGEILVVDYGMGNLHSVEKALAAVGVEARVSDDPSGLAGARGVVLPGVGHFGAAAGRLARAGWIGTLRRAVHEEGLPFLGICLGLQLCYEGSEEGEGEGLGFLPGQIRRFEPGLKVPHMGWNQVTWTEQPPILHGIDPATHFYFVHSYYAPVPDSRGEIGPASPTADHGLAADRLAGPMGPAGREHLRFAVSAYGIPFLAAFQAGQVMGTQFHPEKSGAAGLQILQNFGAICHGNHSGH